MAKRTIIKTEYLDFLKGNKILLAQVATYFDRSTDQVKRYIKDESPVLLNIDVLRMIARTAGVPVSELTEQLEMTAETTVL